MVEGRDTRYIQQEPQRELPSEGKMAYVFPGQGSQFVGMGLELYQSSMAAKEALDELDDILGTPLTRLMFEGPKEELERTINSQPAIMGMSLACLKVLGEFHQQDSFQPVALAGHSLGEYTSLVVAGVLNMADGIRLVRERGRLMQEAGELDPGSMAAIIGLDELTIKKICDETGAEIANINGDDQIVLSGHKPFVALAVEMASKLGARRAIPLTVSGAFHSSLMFPAREGLAAAIEQIDFNDPKILIIGNFTSTPLTRAKDVKDELLNQLTGCVQWKKSVSLMIESGVSSFIELGPGKVLGGLIKRIGAAEEYRRKGINISVSSIGDLKSLQNFNPLPT